MSFTVAVIGANGKMGKIAQDAIAKLNGYSIVAKIGQDDDLDLTLKTLKPDIAIDFTSANSVVHNTNIIIKNNVRPLIGTSGLSLDEINNFKDLCDSKSLGGLIIPNFSIGMALINKFMQSVRQYYSDFSIIEFHHKQKIDKPSGTARHTSSILHTDASEIGSIRSNGFVAKQLVYINDEFERIIVDHESFDRQSFTQGIKISLERIVNLNKLVVGLENII